MSLAEFKEDCEIVKEASKEDTPAKAAEETPSVVDVSEESAEEPPTSSASAEALAAWAQACFTMDGDFTRKFEPSLLEQLVACADPAALTPAEGEEPPPKLEMGLALQLHAAFWQLVAAVAPVAEPAEGEAPAAE